jgi:hypothetical protein
MAGAHGNRTHQEPVSRPLTGFEDRTEHQQRKRSPKSRHETEHDYKRRNPFFPGGLRSSSSEQPILLSRQEPTDSYASPMRSSAVFSGFGGFIYGEFQAHAEGLGVTVQRLQSRVQVPAVFESADRRACQPRAFRRVGQAEPYPFAHLTCRTVKARSSMYCVCGTNSSISPWSINSSGPGRAQVHPLP